ncbi:dihydrodipicolinate synthase family protein [Dactylosporangium salmoneum]|uniref:4-hydroxy-tetrahydrodipicolinate synthase n=1 Tax=Dactylosporangium salmoneum TaxID=53361 RepID=A0ABP5U3R2_9ACTN
MTITGVLPVIPTPFDRGRFDAISFRRLLDHTLASVDGYTLLGSTGEAPSMSTRERMDITETALAMVPDDKTVVVGVTHTSLHESVRLAQHAAQHGAAGVLCASPYYFPNTRDGLRGYLAELSASVDIEVVFYDNPTPTATAVTIEQVLEYAAGIPRLNTVKLTDHGLAKVQAWQQAGLTVLGGDDPILFRYLAAGVDGVMVIAPAIFPDTFRETWQLARAGQLAEAFAIFSAEILPFLHVFGIGDEIATSKAVLHEIGVFASDEVRLPLVGVDQRRRELLSEAYRLCRERTATRTASGSASTEPAAAR